MYEKIKLLTKATLPNLVLFTFFICGTSCYQCFDCFFVEQDFFKFPSLNDLMIC